MKNGNGFYIKTDIDRSIVFHQYGDIARFDFIGAHQTAIFALNVVYTLPIAFDVDAGHLTVFEPGGHVFALDLAETNTVLRRQLR